MKIIIVGAGEVGTHLAKMLSRENQDIILIDSDERKLEPLDASYNLMTIAGSPTSIKIMKEAGIHKCDLFIAVTPHETSNITACMLASNLGAKQTVARIDNYEYLQPENKAFFQKLGINELIYPEMLAAQEIVTALKRTWVRHWFEFCNGKLILIGVKLRESSSIINCKLSELTRTDNYFHIALIKRKDETIIPRGNDVLQTGDIVYFTTTPEYVQDIRQLTGKKEIDVQNVMILGGSRITIQTAKYAPEKIGIKVIESDSEKCYKISEKMSHEVKIINGDGRDIDLLREEGIGDVDAFVALTDSSETNILACLTAKGFGVPKTVAEVENLAYISTAEGLNIGTTINKKLIAASRIYQLLLDTDSSNTKCLSLVTAEVIELVAKKGSKITSAPVKELSLPKDITIGGLIRDGKGVVVMGDTQIQPDDHVLVFCLDAAIQKIGRLFSC
ncbi:MAG TPA: Trk system potassium transporter TrkA [Candidatus Gallibacteroides avistercoris]|uniref:Trk system potassium uptake protein TrkA n=1 Tax=Candidatus Gallibacteroides avistercoris TaxID=2840833 RepID=A0A9D1SCN2_9BACT|nr:Trk system potassium transporter TrkA [Candidatus Gallibacteroides avistercoris]